MEEELEIEVARMVEAKKPQAEIDSYINSKLGGGASKTPSAPKVDLETEVAKMIDSGKPQEEIDSFIQQQIPQEEGPIDPKKKDAKAKSSGSVAVDSSSNWGGVKVPDLNDVMMDPNKISEIKGEDGPLTKLKDRGLSFKDKASKELMKEYKDQGVTDYNITPEQIDKRANKLYEDNNKKLATDYKGVIEKPYDDNKKTSMLGNMFDSLAAGSVSLGQMIASVPESLYDIASLPQNAIAALTGADWLEASSEKFKKNTGVHNPVLDLYTEEGEKLKEKKAEYNKNFESTSAWTNLKEGNWSDAFELMANGLLESAPVSIALMAGGAGLKAGQLVGGGTVAMAGQKRLEIAEEDEAEQKEFSPLERTVKSLGLAGAETVFGAISHGTMGKVYKEILLKEGTEVGNQVFKSGLISMYETALKKYGGIAAAGGEGVEEVATTMTQNMINDRPLLENVADSFLLGVGGGLVYGAPINAKNVANEITKGVQSRKVNKILSSDTNSYSTILDPFSTENTGKIDLDKLRLIEETGSLPKLEKALEKEVKKGNITQEEADAHKTEFLESSKALSSTRGVNFEVEERVKAVELIRKKEVLKREISEMDDTVATLKKEELETVSQELTELVEKLRDRPEAVSQVEETNDSETVKEETTDETSKVPEELTPIRDGKQNTEFFTGKAKEASSDVEYTPVLPVDQSTPVGEAYKTFSAGGKFTGHISKMIAGFSEKQKQVAEAIVKGGFKSFLDIGTSEGGMIKTVASQNSNVRAVGVDPNSQMRENFNSTPDVPNAEFRQEAWQASWVDEDGTNIPEFKTDEKFEVVNEDFAFQFMNQDRSKQVKGVKSMMEPDGVFVTSEKFHTENQEENEKKKYDHQKKYFDSSQLTEDKQTIVNGMADDMVKDTDYYNTLKENFEHVVEFWNAGNFKGYLASDSLAKLQEFKENVGDLSSEFTDSKSKTSEANLKNESEVSPDVREKSKALAEKVRKLKANKSIKDAMSKLNSGPTAIFEFAWDGAIETVAQTIELTGDLGFALQAGMSQLRASQWYQGLSDRGRKQAERKFNDSFREELHELEAAKPKQGKLDALSQSTGQKFVDVFTNINRAMKDLKGYRDLYKREGLFESKAAAEVDGVLGNLKDALKEISASNFNPSQVSNFMYSRHALERNAYVSEHVDEENPFGSGLTDMVAKANLEQYTDEQTKELEALSKPFYDVLDASRKRLVDSGLISQAAMDELTAKSEFYVPLTGFADEQIELGGYSREGKGLNVKGRNFKKVAGRTTEAGDVMTNIISQATDIAIRASKNEVLQEFVNIQKLNRASIVPFEIYDQESLPRKKTVGADNKVTTTRDPAQIEDSYVGVKVKGKQLYLKFDNPLLAQNLNRSTDSVVDSFTKWGGVLNRTLSASYTQYNPTFIVPNFFRDLSTGLINLKAQADINPDLNGKDLSETALKELKSSIATIHMDERGSSKKGKHFDYYQEFKEQGAKTGWANRMDTKDLLRHVNNVTDMFGLNPTAKTSRKVQIAMMRGWSGFESVVDNANTSIENGIRLATFVAAREAGVDKLSAASLAKELTINFNRKGEVGGLMNTLFLFFNASAQGTSTFAKNMLAFKTYEDSQGRTRKTLNRGQKVALGTIVASAAITMANMGMAGEDEESGLNHYEAIPDYVKDRNLIIMSPAGDGKRFMIPLPYGYNIFTGIGTMLAETLMGDRTVKSATAFLLGSMLGSFSPLSMPERSLGMSVGYAAVPTIAKPFVMMAENKDNFDNQIYKENFPFSDQLAPAALGSKNTPAFYKNTALLFNSLGGGNKFQESTLGFHPDKAEYVVDFFGGGSLKFLKDVYGTGSDFIDGQETDYIKVDKNKVPLLNKVYGEDTSFPEIGMYYDIKDNYKPRLNYLTMTAEGRQEKDSELPALKMIDNMYKLSEAKLKKIRGKEKDILLEEESLEKQIKLEKIEIQKNKEYTLFIKKYMKVKDKLTNNYSK